MHAHNAKKLNHNFRKILLIRLFYCNIVLKREPMILILHFYQFNFISFIKNHAILKLKRF